MWDIHAHMETPRRSARAQVRETSKLPALSLSLALAKKIHNPLFRRVAGLCRHRARVWVRGRTRVHAVVCVHTYSPPRPRYSSVGYVRVNIRIHVETWCVDRRVRLHTTFLVYTGIWVSVFLESSFSSLDSAFPPRFSLIL